MAKQVTPPPAVIARLKAALGPQGWTEEPAVLGPQLVDWRDRFHGTTPLMLSPRTTAEVSAVVAICAETKTAIVPQGGNTGLVGGQIPTGGEVLLSLRRLNRIRALDPVNNTLTAEAGVILAEAQQAASDADRLFPLSLAAEGTCTIGGNLSTNAGGTGVLRYGNARALALGLEVVLPDGRVWDGLRGLRKDNTGYDLKQLFIGAEGTLGVITAAVLALYPRPTTVETVIVGLAAPADAVALLSCARALSADRVSAFELIPRIGLEFVLRHGPDTRDPFGAAHPWYVLFEIASADRAETARATTEALLATAAENGLIADAVIAQNSAQAEALWRLRELLSEVQKEEGGSIKCDIAVPISAIAAFIAEASKAVQAACPGIRPVPFGHVGDGNVHFNLSQPLGVERAAFLARWDALSGIVHDIAASHGGSISAEHGLGRMKRDAIKRFKSQTELALMATLKRALDPDGIMNPGALVD